MKGDGEVHATALQISSIGAWVGQAAEVAALLVEWTVMPAGTGMCLASCAFAIANLIHHPMGEGMTLAPKVNG